MARRALGLLLLLLLLHLLLCCCDRPAPPHDDHDHDRSATEPAGFGDARSRALQAAVDAATTGGGAARPTVLKLSGLYNFSQRSLVVLGARDLTLEAAPGTTLLFSVWRVPCVIIANGGPCHGDALDDCCATNTCGPGAECVDWSSGVNITNSERVTVRGITIDYNLRQPLQERSGVGTQRLQERSGVGTQAAFNAGRVFTYHNFNSSLTTTEDLTILQAPFMAITNLNGEGGHVFRRVRFGATPSLDDDDSRLVAGKDGVHESDVRKGMLLEDSFIHGTSDDFFNLHTTLMVVMRCETSHSCLVLNPHVNRSPRNTIYASNSVLQTVRPGDRMSFFAMQKATQSPAALARTVVQSLEPVSHNATLMQEAAVFANQTAADAANGVMSFATFGHVDDLWRIDFEQQAETGHDGESPPGLALSQSVRPTSLVNIDSINGSGAVFRNNTFSLTNCNVGRWKSSNGVLHNNTFEFAKLRNLEICSLPSWFEGPIWIRNVTISGNTFIGEGTDNIIHPGPTAENVSEIGNRYLAAPPVPADDLLDEWLAALSAKVPLAAPTRSYPFEFSYDGVSSDTLLPGWTMTSHATTSSAAGRRDLVFTWQERSTSPAQPASGLRVGVNVSLFSDSLDGATAVDQTVWFSNPGSAASGIVTLVNSLRVSWQPAADGDNISDAVRLHSTAGVDGGEADYQIRQPLALHSPGGTGPSMRLVNTHGYFSGSFDLQPTAAITNETACVAFCEKTATCTAITWSPRPTNPCVMYTAITSTVVPFAGCDNWVKKQQLSQKNFSCLSGMPNKGTMPFWQLEFPAHSVGVSLSLGWIGQWAASFTRDDSGATTARIGFGGDGAGGPQTAAYPAFRVPARHTEDQELRMVRAIAVSCSQQDKGQQRSLHDIGLNSHRRFVLEHLTPRHANQPYPLVSTLPSVDNVAWHSGTDAEIIEFIDSASHTNRLIATEASKDDSSVSASGIEEIWIDTGWFRGYFPGGDWRLPVNESVNHLEHPTGSLQKVFAHGRAQEPWPLKSVVWFMPETSVNITTCQNGTPSSRPSWLQQHHPAAANGTGGWVIYAGGELPLGGWMDRNAIGTVNFGLPEVREWMTDYISAAVTEWGLDTFRFEGGCMWGEPPGGAASGPQPIRPLDGRQSCFWIWDKADRDIVATTPAVAPASGLSEAKHIAGFLRFLDDVVARHPGLALDSVAGGGLRLEMEMASRTINKWRSDSLSGPPDPKDPHEYDARSQVTILGLSHFFPLHASACWSPTPYAWRSAATTGCAIFWDTRNDSAAVRQQTAAAVAETHRLRPLWANGEFHILLHPASMASDHNRTIWAGWQLHSTNGSGAAILLRREHAPASQRVVLVGVDVTAAYIVRSSESFAQGEPRRMSGAALRTLTVTVAAAPGSMLVEYMCVPATGGLH
jgi:hypothetical protein